MYQRVSRLGLYQARMLTCSGGAAPAVIGRPVGIEAVDDRADVAERRAGGVGVAAVGDDLQIGGQTGGQAPLKSCPIWTTTRSAFSWSITGLMSAWLRSCATR